MKILLQLFLFIIAGNFILNAQSAGDNVFAGTQIHTIKINFSQPNYWDSLTIYYNQGNEQYMRATVTLNNVVYNDVGVRLKGNSSYSHPNNKKPIRLSFDEYISDQRWDGLKGVHLNNCWGDPTFMREKLHLDFARDAGISAPRANYASVYINDQLWGFYSLVEHVDKRFLDSRYGNTNGNLFKAVDGFGSPVVSDFRWYGSATSNYTNRYELKTEESTTGWTDLVRTIDTIVNSPNTATSLPTQVNLNALYRAIAADNLFGNLDSYINGGRNFYFYYNPSNNNKMEWIVWDVSLSFGAYSGGVSNIEGLSVTYVSSATNRPLVGKIMNTPALRNEYLRQLCYLKNNYYSTARLYPKIDSLANLIRPYVTADPRKMYTMTQFETNINSDINASGGGGLRKPGLKSFINLRANSVQTQLNNLAVSCNLPAITGEVVINEFLASNTIIPDPDGNFDDWIELYNNTNQPINLSGMFLSDDALMPQKWEFPANTIIHANGFLIVWADEDTVQPGLHTNFKLSADGEHLRLSNIDGSVLDSITFGPQVTNISMSRIPNGTGNFIQTAPTFNAVNSVTSLPIITGIIVPKYIQGFSGTNNNRVPYIFRARLDNLQPNTTYRFINQMVLASDGPTTSGAANAFFINSDTVFIRTTGPTFNTAGNYGEFTTDANGTYTGWFINEPTGNARFVPGGEILARIRLNDGAGGTSAATYLTVESPIKVVDFGTGSDTTQGSAIFGRTEAAPKNFVFLYDNVEGEGRPLAGSIIEKDGLNLSGVSAFALFYRDSVDQFDGAWGTIIPNQLASGVRRVEGRTLFGGNLFGVSTSQNGIWQSGVNTINPSNGIIPIKLSTTDAPVPVELVSYSANINGKNIILNWTTASERNNRGFEIQRTSPQPPPSQGGGSTPQAGGGGWEVVGFVNGNGTTTEFNNYSFADNILNSGKYSYRLKQIDFNGSYEYSNTVEVEIGVPQEFALFQNYPNPFNPSTTIEFVIASDNGAKQSVQLKVYDVLGNEVATLVDEYKEPGKYTVRFPNGSFGNAANISSGVYFYQLTSGDFNSIKKMILLR